MSYVKTVVLLMMTATATLCHAQEGNPYASLGYEGKVHTLLDDLPVSHMLTFEDSTGVKKLNFLLREGKVEVLNEKDSILQVLPLNVYVQTRWLSVDPKAQKYPGDSPYVFVGNSAIWMVDPDGQEKIVVVGNQGLFPDGDAIYKSTTRHFLQAGLEQAISYNNQSNEATTLLIYRGEYTQEQLDNYTQLANAEGIRLKVLENVNEIADYVNTKNGNGDSRSNDLITDFAYVGHGDRNNLFIGNSSGSGKRTIDVDDIQSGLFSKSAFHKSSSAILNSCLSCNSSTGIGSAFAGLVGKEVVGTKNYVNWGDNGLGSFDFNSGTYNTAPPGSGVKTIPGTGGVNGPIKPRFSGSTPIIQDQDMNQPIGPRQTDGSF